MTKKIFLLQFSLILLIFVFPPIFVKNGQNAALDLSKFNFFVLVNFCAALLLLAQKRMAKGPRSAAGAEASPRSAAQETEATPKRAADPKIFERPKRAASLLRAAVFASRVLVCYGSLLLLGIFFYVAQKFLEGGAAQVTLPQNFWGWLACAFTLFAAALYEETLYRWHLPWALKKIASPKGGGEPETAASPKTGAETWKARAFFWGTEAACAVLFALVHRWQGALAVLNAFFAGIALRVCTVKAKSLAPGIAAHFLYNASALLFSL